MSEKSTPIHAGQHGFHLRRDPESEADDATTIEEGDADLPRSYGVDTIFLIAQDPHWLFTYWDIDISKHPGGATYLRCCRADGTIEQEIEVPFETRNWYIPVNCSNASYFVEIGYRRGEAWHAIARSATVGTPPEELSTEEDFDFATVPLHLSFQRLADNLHSVLKSGENLMHAVARMQKGGDFSGFGAGVPPLLSVDHKNLLVSLLGPGLFEELSSGGGDSSALHARVQERIRELLSSGGASETIATLETLSSFSGASAFASEFSGFHADTGVSSWSPEEMASWAAGWITSWAQSAGASWPGGAVSSWGGESSGALLGESTNSGAGASSWSAAAMASWLSAATSSGALSGMSSETLASVTSWLSAVQSSWARAAGSSWASGAGASWLSGIESSGWAASSEESSGFSLQPDRKFFMHVNAEVIFYGGTDPGARVTIDGHPVALNADGSFRYHCVFPNADYDIAIVAVSPDGKESRKATLRFHRDTEKVGDVTDTPQPAIPEPVGRVI